MVTWYGLRFVQMVAKFQELRQVPRGKRWSIVWWNEVFHWQTNPDKAIAPNQLVHVSFSLRIDIAICVGIPRFWHRLKSYMLLINPMNTPMISRYSHISPFKSINTNYLTNYVVLVQSQFGMLNPFLLSLQSPSERLNSSLMNHRLVI